MQTLRNIQKHWQDYLLNDKPVKLSKNILPPVKDTILERIAIYADAYEIRLIESLQNNFPYLRQWLTEDVFYTLAQDYLNAHPSRYISVREFGQHLPHFLISHATYQKQPAYAELAALEWAISAAIDLPDAMPLKKDALQKIPPEQWGNLTFGLHPSLLLSRHTTNSIAIYEALTQQKLLPATVNEEEHFCRIFRRNLQVYYARLSREETCFLTSIQKGLAFEEICEALCQLLPENKVVSYMINQLLRWLDEELLASINIKETA